MKGIISGILCVLFAMALPVMASADQDSTNSRCHDTDRGLNPYVFGSVRAGSLFMEDRCIIDDNGIAIVQESWCKDFDNWCYYAGVSRTIRYPSFDYAGYRIDVSEIGDDYAVFHILKEGEDKEYRISLGEVMHTTHGIIIRLDTVEPWREGVAYSVANEYFQTESYLCTGGCYAGACIGNLTPMDVVGSTCKAPNSMNVVTPVVTPENDTLPANDTVNTTTDALPNITITPANAALDPVNSTHDDKKVKKDKKVIKDKKDKETPKVIKADKKINVKRDKNQVKKVITMPPKKNTGNGSLSAILIKNDGKNIKLKK